VRRREFLVGGLAGTALVACGGVVNRPVPPPTAHERRTIVAIADTFLPGDDGSPGATDVDAITTILDPSYGVAQYLPDVVLDVDQWCLVRHQKLFADLPAALREQALEERMGLQGALIKSWYARAYEGILALAKLAYFGALTRTAGTAYVAFPGASRGYAAASAAGAYAAEDTPVALVPGAGSTIKIIGDGKLSSVRAGAGIIATSGDNARATLRVIAPDGRHHDLPLLAGSALDNVELPLTGGPAAGSWRLEIGVRDGIGLLTHWTLAIRTDLDEAAWRT
jgi:long-chain-alcohol oxidase